MTHIVRQHAITSHIVPLVVSSVPIVDRRILA